MRLLADLHTHTIASGHAYSTLTEMVRGAVVGGLELIAITDHGPAVPQGSHPWYFWNSKALPAVMDGVRILKGCESNISPTEDNGLDLPDEVLEKLDFVGIGFHPLTGFDDGDIGRNTEAIERAIANPLVDMVTHPGNGEFPVHLERVVAAALEHGVILEINDHSFHSSSSRSQHSHLERELVGLAHEAGCHVAINSDAHYHLHVGRFDHAIAVAEEAGFTEADIVNRHSGSVLEFLLARRARPRLNMGGEWVDPTWEPPSRGNRA